MSKRRQGLTLIELLVVLGVISLLAAIALPAVMYGRQVAHRSHCHSNLHQLGVAMHHYLDNHRGRFPEAATMPSLRPDLPGIHKILSKYCEDNPKVFECPSDTEFFDKEGLSYEYPSIRLEGQRLDQIVLRRGETVRGVQHVWILYDFDAFHGAKGQPGARNFLYADGHVAGE